MRFDPRDPKVKLLFSGGGAALLAGCLVLLNLLGRLAVVRLDFSQGRAYSLSPASKRLLDRLEDPLYVRAYFSKTLPSQFAANRDYAVNLLKEYRQRSGGRIRLEFVDVESQDKKSEAIREGILPVRFNIISRERYEVREALLGLVLQYEDKKESLPFVQETRNLEYDITSRIKKLATKERKTLGYVTAGRARGIGGLGEAVQRQLSTHYDAKNLDLDELKPGDPTPTADGILVLGPTEKLSAASLYRLDQLLLSGKPMAVAVDVKRGDLHSFMLQPMETGLPDWLAAYGIKVVKNVVLDMQNQKVQINAQQGWIEIANILDYPPFVVSTTLAPDHPLTKGLDSLTMPFVSPLEISVSSGVKAVKLVESSAASWIRPAWATGVAPLNPFTPFAAAPDDTRGPFTLAAAVEGRMRSAFPSAPEGVKLSSRAAEGEARLVVLGTSRLADAQYPNPPPNQAFALNLVDFVMQDPDLIAIRSKAVAFRPLRVVATPWKVSIKYADMFAPPFFVVGVGLWRWRRRRRHKQESARRFGTPLPSEARGA